MSSLSPMPGQPVGGGGFNAMAAGKKMYGSMGRSMPTMGPVNPSGYAQRDRRHEVRRNAMLRKMQDLQAGNSGSANALAPLPQTRML